MAIRQVRTIGDDILRKECKPVKEITPRIAELIEDMFETMYEANGVGLAAPQVGILKQIVVMDVDDGNQRKPDRSGGVPECAWKGRHGNPPKSCGSTCIR